MATMMRAASTIFSHCDDYKLAVFIVLPEAYERTVLPMLMTLMPSGLVFHKYGSMCVCMFLEPRWACAASSFSISSVVCANDLSVYVHEVPLKLDIPH